jgi:hypothetical protein
VVSFTPQPLYPRGKSPWIGGWVCPRGVLGAEVKRKIPSPRRKSKARTPIVQSVALAQSPCWCCSYEGIKNCETLSLTLRDEHRLRVYENKVLRRIFGPKGEEFEGG